MSRAAARARVLAAVKEIAADGWPVTVNEVRRAVGAASKSTVWRHLDTLEREGLIRRHPRNPKGGFLPTPTAKDLHDRGVVPEAELRGAMLRDYEVPDASGNLLHERFA